MAKMFYSLDEAARKLGKDAEQVREMIASGQLQEFKDRDKLVLKKEQVDLLAGDASDESAVIPLADSAGNSGIGLSLEDSSPGSGRGGKGGSKSGSSMGIETDEPKERSGISIFDTESTEEGDPSAVTRITTTRGGDLTAMESVGSGSGLLDLTREADDTSLGADLLEDVYKGNDDSAAGVGTGSGLFESTAAPSDISAAAAAAGMGPVGMIAIEPYNGLWSGIAGGLAAGAALVMLVALGATLAGLMSSTDNPIVSMIAGNLGMWLGILVAIVLLTTGIGFFLGKREA